jgi:hypothetical protein
MNKYCFNLNIPVRHPLKDPSVLIWQVESDPNIWWADKTNVSEEFWQFLDKLELTMTYPILLFYTPEMQGIPIHIDGPYPESDRAVMNWCVGGAASEMFWYKLKENIHADVKITPAGTPYTRYTDDQVIFLHRQPVGWPSIVQTGIPHKITNYGPDKRWVLSCDISLKSNPELGLTWAQAQEIFKPWIA